MKIKFAAATFTFWIMVAMASGCSRPMVEPDDGRENFVELQDRIPTIAVDVRYYSADNFVGQRVDGYEQPVILLSKQAADALSAVQERLKNDGLGLKVFDAYRPQTAVNHFVRWAADPTDRRTKQKYYPDLPKDRLFELGYIAKRSGHTRGSTLDLTLIDLSTGEELDMGSGWDFFGEISHHDSPLVDRQATANRERLRDAMVAEGFRPYANEWWHYTLDNEPFPDRYFDFPVR